MPCRRHAPQLSPVPMAGLHILIPIHDFNAGGTEAIAFRLAGEWLARGCRVSVLAGDHAGPLRDRVPCGAEILVLDPPVPRSPLSRMRLGSAMAADARALDPDFVFLIGNFHYVLAHAFKRALPGVPIVAKISNPLLPDGIIRRLAEGVGGGLMRRYLAPIDRFVAMTAGQARDLRAIIPGKMAPVIADPNVPDDQPIRPMRDRRAKSGPIRLILVGRLEPQKDVALALDVLAALKPLREARLTVLGEGYLRSELEARAKDLGVEDCVAMPGFSDRVSDELAESDLLLITSRFEGVPGVAIEALAAGLPVVSTDCSEGLASLLGDRRLGRIVAGRVPHVIAAALCEQMTEAPAPPELLEATLAPSRYSVAAEAYLRVFESTAASKSA